MNNRTIVVFLLAALSVALVSCQRAIIVEEEMSVVLTAHMELRNKTKTVLSDPSDGKYYALWAEGDTMAVFPSPGSKPGQFYLQEGAGETTAIFGGQYHERGASFPGLALFPYADDARWENDVLTFSLPQEQLYKPRSFASNAFPMIAVGENSPELHFKNLCSVVKLSLRGSEGVVLDRIKLKSEKQYLCGEVKVDTRYEDYPLLEMMEGGAHEVILNCSGTLLDKDVPTDFFVVVPSQTYEGLTIVVEAITGSITKTVSQTVSIKRSELRPISPFIIEVPPIDFDNLPDNHIWYKTTNGQMHPFDYVYEGTKPFNVDIVSHTYTGEYGVIILSGPLTELHYGAFKTDSDAKITELHLPDCVEVLEQGSIPESLKKLRIPSNINKFGVGVFCYLSSVSGPLVAEDGRSIIKDHVLMGVASDGIEEYVTPNGVRTIGKGCFSGTLLKSVTISEGVSVIEESVFYFMNELEYVFLPESIRRIESQNDYIPKLKGFFGSSHCTSADHVCLIDPRGIFGPTIVIIAPREDLESYTIPDGIVGIGASFKGWKNLRSVHLPASLQIVLSGSLFVDCPNIERFYGPAASEDGRCIIIEGILQSVLLRDEKSIVLPSALSTSSGCLYRKTQLESITLSSGYRSLGAFTFEYCLNLRTVTLPNTITDLGQDPFYECNLLESVYLPVRIPPAVRLIQSNVPSGLKIYVPEVSLDLYKNEPNWLAYKNNLVGYHFDDIDPPAPYKSSDYSEDGLVMVLQTAREGQGIDLVLVGDAFSDRQIASGEYLSTMETAAESFFGIEPYRSFRHLFNVYAVNAVSSSEDYTSGETALGCHNENDYIVTERDKCIEYALKAIPTDRLFESTIIVVCSSPGLSIVYSKGSAMMIRGTDTPISDFSSGIGLAVVTRTGMWNTIRHEAGGHGFAKLADEYSARGSGTDAVTPEFIEALHAEELIGWSKNIDVTSSFSDVKWSRFLSDSRYEKEELGVYEGGGAKYTYGVFRPSELSIMNVNNLGGFNAPSREAIYYRIHKLAYGSEWQYDYEEFVRWDQGVANIHPTSVDIMSFQNGNKKYEVRNPLPVTKLNSREWTVAVAK